MNNRREFFKQTGLGVLGVYGITTVAHAGAKGIKYKFDSERGTWSVTSGGAAPWSAEELSVTVEVNGQKHRFSRPLHRASETAPNSQVFGPGTATRYVLPRKGNRPSMQVLISTYEHPARLCLHYKIENDTDADIRLGQVVIESRLLSPTWSSPLRVFVNSGSQGFSGSQSLEGQQKSAYLTMIVPPGRGSNLFTGFISYRRADAALSLTGSGDSRVAMQGLVSYNDLRLPTGQSLLGEDLELVASVNPHELLEGYADEVSALHNVKFNRDLTGMWNLWYAYWDPTSSQIGEKQILDGANVLDESFGKYGIRYVSTGVWQNRAAFGERETWPGNFPHGLAGTARALCERGYKLMSGGFMAKVSSCTETFKNHPEWLIHDADGQAIRLNNVSWGACPYPSYALDITHPDAEAWFRDWVRDLRAGGDVDYFWMDFEGTAAGGHHDDTVCAPFETDRKRVGIVREALGPAGKIGTYTSPTNRYLGLVDRVRLGSDAGGINLDVPTDKRWNFLMTCVRNMSAGYFYHGKFWWNDPDPGMPGDENLPETIEEGRCRLLYSALTGSFVTIGQKIPMVDPGRLRLIKMSLPPMGIAARPMDLFEAECPSIFDWRLETAWDAWHVVTLINWEMKDRKFNLTLSDFGITGTLWAYELWTDTYLGEVSDRASFTLPPRASRVYALRPKRQHPWFLATDLHVGMGYHELSQVHWDPSEGVLSAKVDRPSDLTGKVVVTIPEGWKLNPATSLPQVGEHVARVPLEFTKGAANLALRFERT